MIRRAVFEYDGMGSKEKHQEILDKANRFINSLKREHIVNICEMINQRYGYIVVYYEGN